MDGIRTLRMYARFIVGLPRHLRRRITLPQAEEYIRTGLRDRAHNFLRIARDGIYGNPCSPYLSMLSLAGCEYGDLEASVHSNGLEPTLETLRNEGVYVTFEEYKGREPIVRSGKVIETDQHAFDNPLAVAAFAGETGGSTGRATRVETDLDNIYSHTAHMIVNENVHGLLGLPRAAWKGTLPDGVGTAIYLRSVLYDEVPERWFTPVAIDASVAPLRFRLATWYLLGMSRLCGAPCPWPEPLPLERAVELARWAADAVQRAGGCHVVAGVAMAVRVCVAAAEAGIDLAGASFTGGGEPFTEAKRAAFDRVGARFIPLYISEDVGPMGLSCAAALEPNEHHLLEDSIALIQHSREIAGAGSHVDAFYFTSLRERAAKLLLNMESDDFGVVEERDCGCPLHRLGYRRHLRRIRSFGKLTGEGVTLVGSDMVRILEEYLPARFGGGPQDYQLVEEEDDAGLTKMFLVIDPRVEISSEQEVVEVLLQAVRESSVAGGLASSYWQQGEMFRVRREAPQWTGRGKLPILRKGRRP